MTTRIISGAPWSAELLGALTRQGCTVDVCAGWRVVRCPSWEHREAVQERLRALGYVVEPGETERPTRAGESGVRVAAATGALRRIG